MILFTVFFLLVYFSICLYLMAGLYKNDQLVLKNQSPFVSIIISARNEENNISRCLQLLTRQNYPGDKFEIILVDDNSTDGTLRVAQQFASTYSKVKILKNISDSGWKSSKKEALQQAISSAKGGIILSLDADCSPPPDWMQTIISLYDTHTGFIAGFSPQISDKTYLWRNFLIIDSMAAAIVAAGSMGWNHGITCTGRNLSFRRQSFQDIGGYHSLPDSTSGDDDFLLQHISRKSIWRVKYALIKEAIVPAKGPDNFCQFVLQKQRHLSSGKFYPPGYKAGFAFFHLSNYFLWLCLFYALYAQNFLYAVPWIIKILIDFSILKTFSMKIQYQFSSMAFLPWEGGYFIYHLLAGPGAFVGHIKWK